jgi:hypothetical protein
MGVAGGHMSERDCLDQIIRERERKVAELRPHADEMSSASEAHRLAQDRLIAARERYDVAMTEVQDLTLRLWRAEWSLCRTSTRSECS